MVGAFLRRRDRTVRSLRVEHYSSAVNMRPRLACRGCERFHRGGQTLTLSSNRFEEEQPRKPVKSAA